MRPSIVPLLAILLFGCAGPLAGRPSTPNPVVVEPVGDALSPGFVSLGLIGAQFTEEGGEWLLCGHHMVAEIATSRTTVASGHRQVAMRIVCPDAGTVYTLSCPADVRAPITILGTPPDPERYEVRIETRQPGGFWAQAYNRHLIRLPHLGSTDINFRFHPACSGSGYAPEQ